MLTLFNEDTRDKKSQNCLESSETYAKKINSNRMKYISSENHNIFFCCNDFQGRGPMGQKYFPNVAVELSGF